MAGSHPVKICWTRQEAEQELENVRQMMKEADYFAAPVANLVGLVMEYFAYRGYKTPDANQAFLFLASEIGELADRLVQSQSGEWVRNHPEAKSADPGPEIADVLMMLTALCNALGLDPVEQMREKFKRKGFDPEKSLSAS